jgi:hypothetical protein
MLLTSDHGQIPSPPTGKVDSSRLPWLSRYLTMPPTGEFRASYLHMRPGCGEACIRSLKEHLSDSFIVLTRDEAIDLKLFGEITMGKKHAERVGDLILISKGEKFLHYPYSDFELRARHGGLNRNEMLVPLINLSE